MIGGTFRMHSKLHLQHHKDPLKGADAEQWLLPRTTWRHPLFLVECLLRAVFYEGYYHWRMLTGDATDRRTSAIYLGVVTVLLALWPTALFWAWLVPLAWAVAVFWLIGSALPHGVFGISVHPDQRGIDPRLVQPLTLYHEDHHLRTRYPWYQGPALYAARRAGLIGGEEEQGAVLPLP
jgi:hypothetical protein